MKTKNKIVNNKILKVVKVRLMNKIYSLQIKKKK